MFKEIEAELLSIISDNSIENVAHMPHRSISKTMEFLYNIKFEDIKRIYCRLLDNISVMTIIYNCDDKEKNISKDLCTINGKVHYIIFIPYHLLNKEENNAIILAKTIITYIANNVSLLIDKYKVNSDRTNFSISIAYSIPIITCAVLRNIYSGESLCKLIHLSLSEIMSDEYSRSFIEESINSLLNIFNDGLGVYDLLDNNFICTLIGNEDYPGL